MPGVLLAPGFKEVEVIEPPLEFREPGGAEAATGRELRVLTRAAEVHLLRREEAQRGYPVRIRGVITSVQPEHQAFTIEDSTRGIYVEDHTTNRSVLPRIGEFLEVEGVTDPHKFAPIVNALRITGLGAGRLPEPIRPTWDQLMNGSLDAQYVEIEGIVTAVKGENVTFRTRGGILPVELRVNGLRTEELIRFENDLVRVRGCLFALWDYVTHQVKAGQVRIYDADVVVEQPAPPDVFSSPRRTVAELLLFDPRASAFQPVRVSGQIVHVRDSEGFMMDNTRGLRFVAKNPEGLAPGDLVEVVGFPELSEGASPVLREALVRRTGRDPLPPARKLAPDGLVSAEHDSMLVRVEGILVGTRRTGKSWQLELQSGVRAFVARLDGGDVSVSALQPGSRLELTGVYAGLGANPASGQGIASFELLLNSSGAIRVLARPPWWTLERLLVMVGALACVLAASVLWITQLHRKVEERTAQLEAQIRERQRVEHQREMEQERARVAQDLHDELGSGLTEISMLAARARAASEEKRASYLGLAGDKAREMVSALDEIVWAMNPRHDSLGSLVSYFSLYADRFLGLAGIAWKLDGPPETSDCALSSRHRHQLFLAFKEALTNVVRHSGATEARVSIRVEGGQLRLSVADNGCGLPSRLRTEEMDGMVNMKARLEKLGGRFEISPRPGGGTVAGFLVPVS